MRFLASVLITLCCSIIHVVAELGKSSEVFLDLSCGDSFRGLLLQFGRFGSVQCGSVRVLSSAYASAIYVGLWVWRVVGRVLLSAPKGWFSSVR